MEQTIFESIKKINEFGQEYWSARDLYKILEYTEYGKFLPAIHRAEESCKTAGESTDDHFAHMSEMVEIGSGAKREVENIHLSRYACYLIIQNADPSKEAVALGQRYFAIQTRRQEESDQAIEDLKRKHLRDEMTKHNTTLAETADKAGVTRYGVFTNYGYMGLYNGLDAQGIHAKKGLKKSQKILDHMGSEELAANLFRATQAEARLKRESAQLKDGKIGEKNANKAHYEVGKEVRATIEKLGGTMPEELPATDSITQVTKRLSGKDIGLIAQSKTDEEI